MIIGGGRADEKDCIKNQEECKENEVDPDDHRL